MADESYIQLTLELARKGEGSVSPNPLVGCVIIKNNKIIGAGYHQKFGEDHAEINAINSSNESLEGSTLYVNLEPCSHHGKTAPCVERIIKEKIKRVVIGTLDVNPLVSGAGVKALKKEGIDVKVGILEKECIDLNKFFFKFISAGIPYVSIKAAQTLDGFIADEKGYSQWISSEESRKYVHSLRSKYDAILIGAGTAKKDNPSLTVRMTEGRNPFRVIIDSKLSLNPDLKIFKQNKDKKTIIVTVMENQDKSVKIKKFESLGVKVLFVKTNNSGKVHLKSMLRAIAKLGIASVLVEGGGEIFSSFLKRKLFDDIFLFIGPKLIGSGIKTFPKLAPVSMDRSRNLKILKSENIGKDLLVTLTS